MAEEHSSMCIYWNFGYAFTCWWTLVLFPPFGSLNNVAVNIGIQVLVWVSAFLLVGRGICTKDGLAGKHGHSVFNFSEEMPDCTTGTLCTILHSQQCTKVPNIFTSSPTLVILLFSPLIAILVSVAFHFGLLTAVFWESIMGFTRLPWKSRVQIRVKWGSRSPEILFLVQGEVIDQQQPWASHQVV